MTTQNGVNTIRMNNFGLFSFWLNVSINEEVFHSIFARKQCIWFFFRFSNRNNNNHKNKWSIKKYTSTKRQAKSTGITHRHDSFLLEIFDYPLRLALAVNHTRSVICVLLLDFIDCIFYIYF